MKQFYDFKVEKIKNLSPEDISLRKENLDLFIKNGFPNKKDEDWKFTDLNSILGKNFDNIANKETISEDVEFNQIMGDILIEMLEQQGDKAVELLKDEHKESKST